MGLVDKLRRFKRRSTTRRDFHRASQSLLASADLTHEEKAVLERVSLRIHEADGMYVPGKALHYLSVGLSASRCIREALRRGPAENKVRSILDFPCGYGRVLRYLRAMFPDADITAAEIESSALDFCRESFSVSTLMSTTNFGDLALPQRFDLIWCGSLFTHVDQQSSDGLLRFFHAHLSDHGVCVFTTHGQRSIDWLQSKKVKYNLPDDAQQKVIREFHSQGYGYSDYPRKTGYGISIVSHQRMLELADAAGAWREVAFFEHGWDDHQDVYAFAKQAIVGRDA